MRPLISERARAELIRARDWQVGGVQAVGVGLIAALAAVAAKVVLGELAGGYRRCLYLAFYAVLRCIPISGIYFQLKEK